MKSPVTASQTAYQERGRVSTGTKPADRRPALGSPHADAALTLVAEVVATLLLTYGPMAVAAGEVAGLGLP